MLNGGDHEMNSGYFIRLGKNYLLENKHRVHMELQPSETLEDDMIAQEAAKIKAFQGTLNDDEFNAIKMRAQHLEDVQNTVDPPNVVDSIPSLTLEDIDTTGVEYNIDVMENAYGTSTMLTKNTADGNAGIVYVDVGIDISSLAYTNVQMLPFIISMLSESDTDFNSRATLDSLIGMHTGGIAIDLILTPLYESGQEHYIASNNKKMRSILFFRGKCISENTEKLLHLIKEVAENSLSVSQQKAIQIL